jgi:hypothetical protein
MLLAEWRVWWEQTGKLELRDLLEVNWDPFSEPDFPDEVETELFALARHLHEGANVVDVRLRLSDIRNIRWPDRIGRKWATRDQRVAQKVVDWYGVATGESQARPL